MPAQPPKSPPPRRKPKRRSVARLLLIGVIGWSAAFALLAVLGVSLAVAMSMASLPSYQELMKSPQGQSVVIRAADGTELVTVGPSYGRWLPYNEIPAPMIEAMKAVEDRRFDWHPGVDPIGMLRAAKVNFEAGRTVEGASTITQQLARNLFLTRAQTYGRKVRELILAMAMERKYSKQQIMEAYLNRVYFGGGAYGIDAASRKFYGHPASQLDLEKAAIIAGLVKAPSRYAPTADPERARGRAKVVIVTMRESGAITPEQAASADVDSVHFVVDRNQGDVRYFTDWVLTQLETLTDEAEEPLDVTTSLNPRHQAAAEAAAKAQPIGGTQIAILAMRRDGAVTAMVGGRDYATSIYNRAVVARRQPGSSWKLFDYLVALEEGMTPDSAVVDEPLRIGNWSPRNSNGRYLGAMSMKQAFALSVNTVAVRLAQRFGFDSVAAMARRFGITTPISTQPAMALGASEATLIEMTAAYASIAGGGVEARPWAIQSITTASGRTLYNREPDTPRILVAPFVAQHMTGMLRAAVETGTGRAAQIGRELAGKTGTTSSNKDGWFIGFTPDLVAGVWMGRDDAKPVRGLAGGQAPARAFAAFMSRALTGVAPTPLDDEVSVPGYAVTEPDAEAYGLAPGGELFDNGGQPVNPGQLDPSLRADAPAAPPAQPEAAPAPLTDKWLEEATARGPEV
ncbi:PBP1A family penicillin-binding protein [Sandaracinobacter sp. RS1-74]|nr:PBP1A family penicillin-binding protein [Sandaracinobacteroides sayramensis]